MKKCPTPWQQSLMLSAVTAESVLLHVFSVIQEICCALPIGIGNRLYCCRYNNVVRDKSLLDKIPAGHDVLGGFLYSLNVVFFPIKMS